jgi:monoamine oxidase
MMAERLDTDVVVIGAGLAGLTAARVLRASGRNVAVLEARERVGGRVLNHTFDDGTTVEVGGQWIGPGQLRVNKYVAELGLDTFATYNEGDHVLDLHGRRNRFQGAVPPLPKIALLDLGRSQTRLEQLAEQVPVDAPWAAPRAARWDSETFASWIRRNAYTASARFFWEVYSEAVFAAEPQDFSLLHALFLTHSGGGVSALTGVRDAAQQDRIVGGSALLAEHMADELGPAVVTNCPVRRIGQRADRVVVAGDRTLVTARYAIVAIPPTLASRITYTPALPPLRDQLTQKMPAGSVIKCNVVYDEPFWRARGLSGQAAGDHAPVKFTFDNSPPSGSPGILVCFLEGADARRYGRLSPMDRRDAVLESLIGYFGAAAARCIDFVEQDWAAEEWTRGCYGAHMGPGVWTQFGPVLREPVGRIHWAGAETATLWNGYMDGAIASGERAAEEVLDAP